MKADINVSSGKDLIEDTRQKILRVSRELIARQGIQKTSLASIASAAGISRGTLFYYFPSKQGLLYQVMEDSFQEITDRIMGVVDSIEPGKRALEILRLTLKYTGESAALNQTNHHLFQEAIAGDSLLIAKFQKSYRHWQEIIASCLRQHFPKTAQRYNPEVLSSLILAMIDGISIQALLGYSPVRYEESAETLASFFSADG